MKAIIPQFDENSKRAHYLQLYDYIKNSILQGDIRAGEKLPSLRSLAATLGLSITTIDTAYSQLLVEGYIYSRPQSGYYAAEITKKIPAARVAHESREPFSGSGEPSLMYDLSCFDFVKWKKCMNRVLTEYPHLLFFESEPQGEAFLRSEISRYVYASRGVMCEPEQIVIGAGTQQITSQLSRLLHRLNIGHVSVEEPGYLPVINIFRDSGFVLTHVNVLQDGIDISRLPRNIPSAVYVSPSNQFPTGALMPVGKRYELLEWAAENNSIIIEDDYDSELRYFGKPVPALQGLDTQGHVVYLGSFSSTLFSAIKISYMVLPPKLAQIFAATKGHYIQTCSKAEQLTLALFMKEGLFQTNIKKLRNLYAQKLQAVIGAVNEYGEGRISLSNTTSGVNTIIEVSNKKTADELCRIAREMKISMRPVVLNMTAPKSVAVSAPASVSVSEAVSPGAAAPEADAATGEISEPVRMLVFYYNQIPLELINESLKKLFSSWAAE
ncbi:MAG: PLP-dependent aminotransferase family protein [Clostridia bacterium]|nr:PLP-dependent aminotransferase family protein [Clostridia bacterium]